MMRAYQDSVTVSVVFQFIDDAGDTITPTGVDYRVLDQDDQVLVDWTTHSFTTGDTEAEITVFAANNTLDADQPRGLRAVELRMQDASGNTYRAVSRYVIEQAQPLKVMVNSFQSYNSALLRVQDMPVNAFKDATFDEQRMAMTEAYHRLCRLSLTPWAKEVRDQDRINAPWSGQYGATYVFDHEDYDATRFESLPGDFKLRVRQAQVVEADVILGGDPIGDLSRAGLMSHTAGESSSMFRSGKPLDLPASRAALKYLAGYVSYTKRVGR